VRLLQVLQRQSINLLVHLYPPLNNTAGQAHAKLVLDGAVTIQTVVDTLIERFGLEMRRHLYDTEGCIIPAWSVFVNSEPIQLNRPENLQTVLKDGAELSFIMNIAGG
jgi:molybdopterin converting factor small subunit